LLDTCQYNSAQLVFARVFIGDALITPSSIQDSSQVGYSIRQTRYSLLILKVFGNSSRVLERCTSVSEPTPKIGTDSKIPGDLVCEEMRYFKRSNQTGFDLYFSQPQQLHVTSSWSMCEWLWSFLLPFLIPKEFQTHELSSCDLPYEVAVANDLRKNLISRLESHDSSFSRVHMGKDESVARRGLLDRLNFVIL